MSFKLMFSARSEFSRVLNRCRRERSIDPRFVGSLDIENLRLKNSFLYITSSNIGDFYFLYRIYSFFKKISTFSSEEFLVSISSIRLHFHIIVTLSYDIM